MREDKVVYSICVADVQAVARERVGRALTAHELELFERRIYDALDWYEGVSLAISAFVQPGESPAA